MVSVLIQCRRSRKTTQDPLETDRGQRQVGYVVGFDIFYLRVAPLFAIMRPSA